MVILFCLVGSQQVLHGRRPALRLRDRRARRHGRAVRDGAADAARGSASTSRSRSRSRDPRVRQVLRLMLPVTIGLGLINFNVLINSTLGSLVSEDAPRAIDAAFRIYMLPQGMFSVAIATVLFPALSRFAARRDYDGLRALLANGMRQIFLLLVPAAAATLALADADHAADLPARRVRRRARPTSSRARSSGSRSPCPSAASTCCSRGPSSASRSRGSRRASRPEPHGQRRRVGRALQAVRHRRDRHRHRASSSAVMTARADVLPAPRAARPPRRAAHARGRRSRSPSPPRCWPAPPTASGTCSTRRWACGLLAQVISVGVRRSSPASSSTPSPCGCCASRRRARSRASSGDGLLARRTVENSR